MPLMLPPVSLLESADPPGPSSDHPTRASAIRSALEAFEASATVVAHECGPSVTMYELELAPGTRVSKILGLAPDLAICLAVPSIRIVHPLPGKTTIGIEVPNALQKAVRLRTILEREPKSSSARATCSS